MVEGEQSTGVSTGALGSLSGSAWLARVPLAPVVVVVATGAVVSAVDCGSFLRRFADEEGDTRVWAEDGALLVETGTTTALSEFTLEELEEDEDEILAHCCCLWWWWWWRLPPLFKPPDPLWLILVLPQTLLSEGVDVALETDGVAQAAVVVEHNPPILVLLLLLLVVLIDLLLLMLLAVVVVAVELLFVVVVVVVVLLLVVVVDVLFVGVLLKVGLLSR